MSIRLASLQLALAQPARFVLSASARSSHACGRLAPRRYASNKGPPLKSSNKLASPSFKPYAKSVAPPRGKVDPFRRFNDTISNTPVEIYKAPGHGGYMFSCYSIGMLAYMYGVYNSYALLINPVGEVPNWMKYLFGGICVIAGGIGTIFVMRATGVVASITARRAGSGTNLLIRVRRPIPFLKQREIVVPPSQLNLSHKLLGPAETGLPKKHMVEVRRQLENHRKMEATPFYRAPISKTSFLMWKGFNSARKAFTADGFIYVTVTGAKKSELRLDTAGRISPKLELLSQIQFSVKEIGR